MTEELAGRLAALAEKYETADFLRGDPSWFMHQVEGDSNRELVAFAASCLSYGSRKQFFPKIQYLLDCSGGDFAGWLSSGRYEADVPPSGRCYYRLHTYAHMHALLAGMAEVVAAHGSLGAYARAGSSDALSAVALFCRGFGQSTPLVPSNPKSACKRLCMFLRWMSRSGSPVDLGLWAGFIDRRTLIMPLDTHVVGEAAAMGLLRSKAASMPAALKLTDEMRKVFPDDPLKGDFALFGLGVDTEENKNR